MMFMYAFLPPGNGDRQYSPVSRGHDGKRQRRQRRHPRGEQHYVGPHQSSLSAATSCVATSNVHLAHIFYVIIHQHTGG